MMRLIFLTFIGLNALAGFSQQKMQAPGLPPAKELIKHPIHYKTLRNFCFENQLKFDFKPADSLSRQQFFSPSQLITTIITPDRYARRMGFFCYAELQLDKISPVPVRFRLGSVEYVNWMEQKPNAVKPF